jgi:hypothetical protein
LVAQPALAMAVRHEKSANLPLECAQFTVYFDVPAGFR